VVVVAGNVRIFQNPTKTKDRNTKNVKASHGNRGLVSPMESEDDSTTCDAILVTRSRPGEEETMKADAKDAFEQTLRVISIYPIWSATFRAFISSRYGLIVGILSPANRLGLGVGICIDNILDTEWRQKPFYVFHICSAENVFRKTHRNI
jgi:hypothetical protein